MIGNEFRMPAPPRDGRETDAENGNLSARAVPYLNPQDTTISGVAGQRIGDFVEVITDFGDKRYVMHKGRKYYLVTEERMNEVKSETDDLIERLTASQNRVHELEGEREGAAAFIETFIHKMDEVNQRFDTFINTPVNEMTKTPPKKPGFFRRLWNFIKNILFCGCCWRTPDDKKDDTKPLNQKKAPLKAPPPPVSKPMVKEQTLFA